jgi:hypothetical protein
MAKVAFTVDNGLVPGHADADLGHSTAQFRDVHLSRDAHIDADVNVGGDVVVQAGGDVTVGGTSVQGGGSGGGVDAATSIAYSIALG